MTPPVAAAERSQAGGADARGEREVSSAVEFLLYLLMGTVFGIVLVRSEVVSWFRIQEMFRFQGFHMFGIFATAIPTAMLSLHALRRFNVRALDGSRVEVRPKELGRGYRYVFGGLIFGLGWACTGACPGPLMALAGSGIGVIVFVVACAVAGTWVYGHLRPRLPHY